VDNSSRALALPEPPGFGIVPDETESSVAGKKRNKAADQKEILTKKAWDVALNPGKQAGMTLFMLWMSGSSAGIFSVMIVAHALQSAVKSLLSVETAFAPFTSKSGGVNIDVTLQKLLYVAIGIAVTAYIVRSAANVGLIPTCSGDYISMIPQRDVFEHTSRPTFVSH